MSAADRRMYGDKSARRREAPPRHQEPVLRALSGSVYDITPV